MSKEENIGWLKNLQKVREEKGYTQIKLAMMVGMSQQSITYYETGTRTPSLQVARKLADALDTSVDYLLGRDEMLHNYHQLKKEDKNNVKEIINSLSSK
ncbi:MAG: helix-turn-helix transcriptional regulator [Firmicutes bacterium]|nr:helix-turn-helix transcriptional regulator [Bacillota bacterium]